VKLNSLKILIFLNIQITDYKQGDYDTLIKLWEVAGLPYKPLGRDSHKSIAKEIDNGISKFCLHNFATNILVQR